MQVAKLAMAGLLKESWQKLLLSLRTEKKLWKKTEWARSWRSPSKTRCPASREPVVVAVPVLPVMCGYILTGLRRLAVPSEMDLLDLESEACDRSRLSCQIELTDELDGLVVEVAPF